MERPSLGAKAVLARAAEITPADSEEAFESLLDDALDGAGGEEEDYESLLDDDEGE
jgi:hypothetical protein